MRAIASATASSPTPRPETVVTVLAVVSPGGEDEPRHLGVGEPAGHVGVEEAAAHRGRPDRREVDPGAVVLDHDADAAAAWLDADDDRPASGFPAARRTSAGSIPWSTAFRTRWRSGARRSSTRWRSSRTSAPSTRTSTSFRAAAPPRAPRAGPAPARARPGPCGASADPRAGSAPVSRCCSVSRCPSRARRRRSPPWRRAARSRARARRSRSRPRPSAARRSPPGWPRAPRAGPARRRRAPARAGRGGTRRARGSRAAARASRGSTRAPGRPCPPAPLAAARRRPGAAAGAAALLASASLSCSSSPAIRAAPRAASVSSADDERAEGRGEPLRQRGGRAGGGRAEGSREVRGLGGDALALAGGERRAEPLDRALQPLHRRRLARGLRRVLAARLLQRREERLPIGDSQLAADVGALQRLLDRLQGVEDRLDGGAAEPRRGVEPRERPLDAVGEHLDVGEPEARCGALQPVRGPPDRLDRLRFPGGPRDLEDYLADGGDVLVRLGDEDRPDLAEDVGMRVATPRGPAAARARRGRARPSRRPSPT